jgi:hypothetical protein
MLQNDDCIKISGGLIIERTEGQCILGAKIKVKI